MMTSCSSSWGRAWAKSDLQEKAGELLDRTVHFCPYQPLSIAVRAMEEADFALVSLERGVHTVAYPSKTMMVLSRDVQFWRSSSPRALWQFGRRSRTRVDV